MQVLHLTDQLTPAAISVAYSDVDPTLLHVGIASNHTDVSCILTPNQVLKLLNFLQGER